MQQDAPTMLFRRLVSSEIGELRAHLLRLSADDRRARFTGLVSDAFIDNYVNQLDWSRAILIGCEVDAVLRAVAELKPLRRHWPPAAEAAFSVEGPYQNRGLGTRLFRRISTVAANRGFRRLFALCVSANRRMRRIARGHAATMMDYDGETEGVVHLPWPTPLSYAQEALDTTLASFGSLTRTPRQTGRFNPGLRLV